jgi:acetyl esterase/lipase
LLIAHHSLLIAFLYNHGAAPTPQETLHDPYPLQRRLRDARSRTDAARRGGRSAVVSFTTNNLTVSEGSGNAVLQLTRSGDTTNASTVSLQSSFNNTAGSSDYGPVPSSVAFDAGETAKDLVIPIVNDTVFEGAESFSLTIGPQSNSSVGSPSTITVTIADDDPASLVGFGQPAYSFSEHDGVANLTVIRTGVTNVTTTVVWGAGGNGTATENSDFIATNGTLTFAPGETSKTVAVPLVDNILPEPTETFQVSLSGVTNGGIASGVATVSILDDDPSATLTFSSPLYTVGEGDGFATITVVRGTNTAIPVTVQYGSSIFCCSSSATPGQDYIPASGTLAFAPGETSKSFSVAIFDDISPENDEEFTVAMSNPTNATFLPSSSPFSFETTARVRITDNDSATRLAVSPTAYFVAENGGSASVTIVRSGVTTGSTTVNFTTANGTALAGSDFTTATGNVTFGPGQTSIAIPIAILDDAVGEPNETFSLKITAGGALITADTATITISDDEQLSTIGFTAPSVSVSEGGGSVSLQVLRTGPATQPATVQYSACCATPPGSAFLLVPGTLTFAPGETLKTIAVTIVDDAVAENNETFTVALTSPENAVLGAGSISVTVVDDDVPTTVGFSQTTYEVGEGAGSVALTAVRSGNLSVPTDVTYSSNSTGCCSGFANASPGIDYTPVSGNLHFAPGETSKTILIPIIQDALPEPDEAFYVALSGSGGGTAVVRIRDDEPVPQLSAASVTVSEGNAGITTVSIPVTLSAPLPVAFSVQYTSSNGSAKSPSDYTAVSGNLTFNPGETTRNVLVPIVGDTVDEGDEYFNLTIFSNSAASVPVRVTPNAMVTIRNDDASFSVGDISVTEGDGGAAHARFIVRLSVPLPSPASLAYTTIGGSAQSGSDFTGVSGSLTFAPGETSKEVLVPVIGDRVAEPNETFFLRISDAIGAPISRSQGKATIVNDDAFYVEYDGLEYAGAGKHALALDLFVPTAESATPWPLVVWVHGDHWGNGSDGSRAASPAIREANRGYVVASIDYRSSDAAAFPAQIDDVKAAVRWLRANAARYHIDPERVAVWGFGSGGHLAALAGTSGGVAALEDLSEGNPAFSSRVQLVIDWAGPIDLLQMENDSLACSTMNHDSSGSYESLLLGCSVQLCPDRAAAANPAAYVTPDDPPFLLMHGRADCEVGPAQSESFARVLRAAQLEVALKLYEGVGHTGPFWDTQEALTSVDGFLDTHFKAPPRSRIAGH